MKIELSVILNLIICVFDGFLFCLFLTESPGMLDLKGKAKWDAWNLKKGVTFYNHYETFI